MKQRVVKELIGWKKTMNGRVPIYISSGIGNRNIILYGIPGTGKTRRLIKLALNRVKNGEQVIWFGFHGSNDFDLMPETIKKEYDAVATKRKCFPVLALPWSHNNQPLDADDAAEIAHDLSVAFNLAKTREAAVCDALEEFVEDGRLEKTGLDELIRKLETYETGAAKAAAADMKRYLSEIHVRDTVFRLPAALLGQPHHDDAGLFLFRGYTAGIRRSAVSDLSHAQEGDLGGHIDFRNLYGVHVLEDRAGLPRNSGIRDLQPGASGFRRSMGPVPDAGTFSADPCLGCRCPVRAETAVAHCHRDDRAEGDLRRGAVYLQRTGAFSRHQQTQAVCGGIPHRICGRIQKQKAYRVFTGMCFRGMHRLHVRGILLLPWIRHVRAALLPGHVFTGAPLSGCKSGSHTGCCRCQ